MLGKGPMTKITEIRERFVSPAAPFAVNFDSIRKPLEVRAPVARRRGRMMEAAVLSKPGRFQFKRVAIPRPDRGQILVRMEGCGVCSSNLPPWQGMPRFHYPMKPGALGHEGWGFVESLGPGAAGFRPGDRVAILSHHAYAEYDLAPAQNLVKLPAHLEGRPFPGEPLGCAMNIFARSGIRPGHTVGVVGAGFMGALLIQLAVGSGAQVIAFGRRPYALEMARLMGASKAIPWGESAEMIDEVKKATGNRLCDVTLEVAGHQRTLDLAAEITRECGRLVIAGYHQNGLRQVNMQMWNWRGFDVINAHDRDERKYVEGIRQATAAVAVGRLDPYALLTHRFPLEKLGEALDATRDRPDGFMKALVTFPV